MLTAAFFHHLVESGQLSIEELVLVQMPYKDFNSDETKTLAAYGSKNMHRTLRVIPIDAMVDADAVTNGIEEDTAAHKTLQAAMRFQVLKSIAAKEGGVIICNANKTEIAFGYGTLIGDLRGYFAPWMDCVKGEVYQLAEFMNRVIFKREVIPEACIDIAPMDELTKNGAGNRADPIDYGRMERRGDARVFVPGYHDAMVRSLVELHKGPEWFLSEYTNGTLERSMLLEEGRIDRALAGLHPDFQGNALERFIFDLELKLEWFVAAVHKRVQSVPGAHFSRSSFGWDFWECLAEVTDGEDEPLPVYYPLAYQELKRKSLVV
jgi:NAD+ synthase (glutamine-hydrolysing)